MLHQSKAPSEFKAGKSCDMIIGVLILKRGVPHQSEAPSWELEVYKSLDIRSRSVSNPYENSGFRILRRPISPSFHPESSRFVRVSSSKSGMPRLHPRSLCFMSAVLSVCVCVFVYLCVRVCCGAGEVV